MPDARARTGHDQRHTNDGFIEEDAVFVLPVFTKRLAVVGDDNDQAVVECSARTERVKHAADLLVNVGHLAVIRTRRKLGTKRGRRVVGRVWVVEVHPEKHRLLTRHTVDPLQRVIHDRFTAAFSVGFAAGRHRLKS